MSEADVQEVLCPNPSCGKKYRLKGKVPATFTCTKCGQAMDLSAFAAPEAPAAPAPRGGGRSAARGGRAAAAGARRGRAEEPDEDAGRARYQAPPKNNNALIFGSLGALVAVVLVMVLVMGKKDPPAPAPADGGASAPAASPGLPAVPVAAVPSAAAPVPAAAPVASVPSAPAQPAGPVRSPAPAAEPAPAPAPEPRRSGGSMASLQSWTPPAELQVSAEDKEKIERAVELAIHGAGRDMREAQDQLVALDRKAIWRLVSEFKTIQDSRGFEDRQGLIKASIVDRILRKIDGYMERKCGVREQIKAESSPDWALNVAKRWNGWLERGLWKSKLAPWDPRVDEADEAADKGSGR